MSDLELIEWLRNTNVVIVAISGLQGTPCFQDARQRDFLPDNKLYGDDAVPIRWQIGEKSKLGAITVDRMGARQHPPDMAHHPDGENMSLELAKMEYILSKSSLGYPVGKSFEDGYRKAIEDVLANIEKAAKSGNLDRDEIRHMNDVAEGIRIVFSQK